MSRDDHVTYNAFMDLLCPPDGDAEDWALLEPPAEPAAPSAPEGGEPAGGAPPPLIKRQLSRVQPKGGNQLAQLAQARDREEEEVEAEFKRQLTIIEEERAAREREAVVSSDFSWLRTTRKSGRPPFLVTRHACFYDGTRGTEGSAAGLPVGLEGRGKVRTSTCHVQYLPCAA